MNIKKSTAKFVKSIKDYKKHMQETYLFKKRELTIENIVSVANESGYQICLIPKTNKLFQNSANFLYLNKSFVEARYKKDSKIGFYEPSEINVEALFDVKV